MHINNSSMPRPESPAALRAALHIDHLDGALLAPLSRTAPALTRRIVERIQQEVASYIGPRTGRRRRLISLAASQAIGRFCAAAENKPFMGVDVPRLFQQLGHGERLEDRTLDSMRAAYSIATHEAWAHLHRLATTGALPQEQLSPLTHALFIYMQQLTDQVTTGYHSGGEHKETIAAHAARQKLIRRLTDNRSRESIEELAAAADWQIPTEVTVVRVQFDSDGRPPDLWGHFVEIGPDVLLRDDLHSLTAIASTRTSEQLAQHMMALPGKHYVARSFPVPIEHAPLGSAWARRALRLAQESVIDAQGIVECSDHLALLWMYADPVLMERTSAELLAPLARETPHRRKVLTETLLLWLQTHASAPKLAVILGAHDQTIRHRMHRLKELFGDRMTDPQQALTLLMALQQDETQSARNGKNTHTHDN